MRIQLLQKFGLVLFLFECLSFLFETMYLCKYIINVILGVLKIFVVVQSSYLVIIGCSRVYNYDGLSSIISQRLRWWADLGSRGGQALCGRYCDLSIACVGNAFGLSELLDEGASRSVLISANAHRIAAVRSRWAPCLLVAWSTNSSVAYGVTVVLVLLADANAAIETTGAVKEIVALASEAS